MKEQESRCTYPKWHNAVAGGVAGAGALCATAPLDLLRIRRQLETNVTYPRPSLWSEMLTIVESEGGIIALFRGGWAAGDLPLDRILGRSIHLVCPRPRMASIVVVAKWSQQSASFCYRLLSGGTAGVCATLATYPFDICRTTFAARGLPMHSLRDADGVFRPPKS